MAKDERKDTPLDQKQIDAVQESWKIIAKNSEENGIILIKRLLTEHSELIPLFSFGKCGLSGAAIFRQPTFFRHCQYVMNTLDVAVSGLGDLAALVPVLKELGEKHKNNKVKKAHFKHLQDAFVFMLQMALGNGLTPHVAESWITVYDVLTTTMATNM